MDPGSGKMNQLANVVYPYSPKNDDELELKIGDRIEVIGVEEEGWWKGRLKGRIGVFPSNFVKVIEAGQSPTTQSIVSSPPTNNTPNKLNLSGNKTSRSSLSSTLMTSNNSNSNNSHNNNINNNNNNNLMMNNTQHQDNSGLACGEDPSTTSSERRLKPIRGVGYGDIFASGGKPKPLPADPTGNMCNERLGTSITNTLHKQIPKKPPPPAPTIDNGSSTDQAPALPPKPANQFSQHLQHSSRPHLPATQQQQQHQSAQQMREQARVIYPYSPSNDDELAIEVDDIIDIIDKEVEDAGWWKGELRGKIGVFPNNFVKLIIPDNTTTSNQDWHHRSSTNVSQPATPNFNNNTEGKIKSVFASTPKGFSKELENNLEKHNSPASFLSLKRNKLQQQMSTTSEPVMNDTERREDNVGLSETNTTKLNHITANRAKGPSRRPPSNVLNKRNQPVDQVGRGESNGRDDPSLGSLPINSITQSANHDSLSSLPTGQHANQAMSLFSSKPNNPNDGASSASIKPSLSLDNVIDNQVTPKTSQRVNQTPVLEKSKSTNNTPPWMVQLKKTQAEKKRDSPSVNVAPQEDEAQAPKVSDAQALPNNAVPSYEIPMTDRKPNIQALRGAYNPTSPSTTATTTPSAGAVKSLSSRYSGDFNTALLGESPRNSLLGNSTNPDTNNELASIGRPANVLSKNSPPKTEYAPSFGLNSNLINNENVNSDSHVPSDTNKFACVQPNPGLNSQANTENNVHPPKFTASSTKSELDKLAEGPIDQVPMLTSAQYDNLLKQISKNVTSEIGELREDVKRLQQDFHGINELKGVLEVMKSELKACQSATENQRRYIKELVNNLADERKKIAAMQEEIDRNLK